MPPHSDTHLKIFIKFIRTFDQRETSGQESAIKYQATDTVKARGARIMWVDKIVLLTLRHALPRDVTPD